jgi:DNA-directed RNA polymerase specialized sigma24 family protein
VTTHKRNDKHLRYWMKKCSEHEHRLGLIMRRFADTADEGRDILQGIKARILKYPKDPETLTKGPLEYLIVIGRRLASDMRKSANRKQMDTLDDPLTYPTLEKRLPVVEPEAIKLLQMSEWRSAIQLELETMPGEEQQLYELRLRERPNEEIAIALDCTEAEVGKRWNTLVTKLKHRIRKKYETGRGEKPISQEIVRLKRGSRKLKTKHVLTNPEKKV